METKITEKNRKITNIWPQLLLRTNQDRKLNMSASGMQQANHSLTSIMKHPLLSSLSQSLYSIAFPHWHPAKHNLCSQCSVVHRLKVILHLRPGSAWTVTVYSNSGRKLCLTTNTVALPSAADKLNHLTIDPPLPTTTTPALINTTHWAGYSFSNRTFISMTSSFCVTFFSQLLRWTQWE